MVQNIRKQPWSAAQSISLKSMVLASAAFSEHPVCLRERAAALALCRFANFCESPVLREAVKKYMPDAAADASSFS